MGGLALRGTDRSRCDLCVAVSCYFRCSSAFVSPAKALKLTAPVDAGLMQGVPRKERENLQAIDRTRDKADLRSFGKVTCRDGNLFDGESGGYRLGNNLLIKNEFVGVHAEVDGLEQAAIEGAISSVVLGMVQAKRLVLQPGEKTIC